MRRKKRTQQERRRDELLIFRGACNVRRSEKEEGCLWVEQRVVLTVLDSLLVYFCGSRAEIKMQIVGSADG